MSIGLKEKLLSTLKQNSTQYDTSLFRKLYLTYLKKNVNTIFNLLLQQSSLENLYRIEIISS